jgi:hypothetical protein
MGEFWFLSFWAQRERTSVGSVNLPAAEKKLGGNGGSPGWHQNFSQRFHYSVVIGALIYPELDFQPIRV